VGDCAAQTMQDEQNIATTKTAIEMRIGCVFLQFQVNLKSTREWDRPDMRRGRMVKLELLHAE
jgi:hypothetical protein